MHVDEAAGGGLVEAVALVVGGQVELQGDVFEFGVRGDQHHRAGRLVDLAALDAHQPILHDVEAPDTLRSGAAVELLDRRQHRHRLAVDGHRHAAFEADDHLVGDPPVDRGVFGVGVDVLGWGIPQVL
ncbi:Uncharacterised protein [Mycobacterium tuberculosis]|uniref:Uncharacterized protein n=1 Tax=Mycobacterium tuberculosis TaxID=1773 RepID=A0A655JA01_MYCTX|nr:Uncharacterised protein [Mycobacterium tuberculosis]